MQANLSKERHLCPKPDETRVRRTAGELTGVAAKLADEGLNLEALYVEGLAGDLIELAIVADNMKKAKKVLAAIVS